MQQQIDRTLAWAEVEGNHILTLADDSYPKALLSISDPPPLLYAKGRVALLSRPALAIVGSRSATVQGMQNAERFAQTLTQVAGDKSSTLVFPVPVDLLGSLLGNSTKNSSSQKP